jgi:protein-S-isoprenylcysteine O-methyltransferase Ste14
MIAFKIVYWLGMVIEVVIRAPFRKSWKQTKKTERRHSTVDQVLLLLMSVAGLPIPLIYSVTSWLAFADYRLPAWFGWWGVAVIAGPLTLILYIPLYIIRVPSEEKLMLDKFGEQYRDYIKKTGAIIPRFK